MVRNIASTVIFLSIFTSIKAECNLPAKWRVSEAAGNPVEWWEAYYHEDADGDGDIDEGEISNLLMDFNITHVDQKGDIFECEVQGSYPENNFTVAGLRFRGVQRSCLEGLVIGNVMMFANTEPVKQPSSFTVEQCMANLKSRVEWTLLVELPFSRELDDAAADIVPSLRDYTFKLSYFDESGSEFCKNEVSTASVEENNKLETRSCSSDDTYERPLQSTLYILGAISNTNVQPDGLPPNPPEGGFMFLLKDGAGPLDLDAIYCAHYEINEEYLDVVLPTADNKFSKCYASQPDDVSNLKMRLRSNECASDPCMNNGTCSQFWQAYTCVCTLRYTGSNCETELDYCTPNPCENGGTCNDYFNTTTTCTCPDETEGDKCEVQTACFNAPCKNQGTCYVSSDFPEGYFCLCANNTYGDNCEVLDSCASGPCLNNGSCINVADDFICLCPADKTGPTCETDFDSPCRSTPCENGGTCVPDSEGDTYTCQCPPEFIGATCNSPVSGVALECEFEDDLCSLVQNDNDDFSWTRFRDGTSTADTGPSAAASGSYYIYIEATGRQINDDAIIETGALGLNGDACVSFSYHMYGQNTGTLQVSTLSTAGSESVVWEKRGDQGNQWQDEAINIAMTPTQGVAFRGVVGGELGDIALDSIEVSAGFCADICLAITCENGGTCLSNRQTNHYICQCLSGYTGTNCESRITGPCGLSPCLNGGTCLQDGSCQCLNGYTGSRCETLMPGPCSSAPCQNGGTCVVTFDTTFTCNCLPTFSGQTCEMRVTAPQLCQSMPCQNGASCYENTVANIYVCVCTSDYAGRNCDEVRTTGTSTTTTTSAPGPCDSQPCQNGGSCFSNGDSDLYVCLCADEFTGANCDTPIGDPCSPNPCENGGSCVPNGADFPVVCRCPEGYYGLVCESRITVTEVPCDGDLVCQNGGTCYHDGSTFRCKCASYWDGPECTAWTDWFIVAVVLAVITALVILILLIVCLCHFCFGWRSEGSQIVESAPPSNYYSEARSYKEKLNGQASIQFNLKPPNALYGIRSVDA